MPNEKTILIGCRLPHGLTLTLRNADNEILAQETVKGMNSSVIKGATYTTTVITEEFWEEWKKTHINYRPLKTGAIFEARSEDHAKHRAKELSKEKTGFEPISPDAHGVKPRNDKE